MRTARMIIGVLSWPVASQQQARRNALLAATALAQAAHERRETEEFLAAHAGRPPADRLAAAVR